MSEPILIHGDCLDVLRRLPAESVAAIVTDPPYGLADHKPAAIVTALTAWANGDREHVPNAKGFMGKDWDAFVPPPAVWDECLRALKPGGHLVAFAGSRTYDLMGLSIRMAGFEIRDGLQWIYGSGMPKSLDVSKAIDKVRDDRSDVLMVGEWLRAAIDAGPLSTAEIGVAFGLNPRGVDLWAPRPTDNSARQRAHVPTWEQWEKLRDLLGFGDDMDAEVWRLNGRKGTPGEAWEQREITQSEARPLAPGDVISFDQRSSTERERRDIPVTDAAHQWQGWGTALKPAHEPIVLARKPLGGTVAATVLQHGTGAINIDACRVNPGSPVAGGGGWASHQVTHTEGWDRPYANGVAKTEGHSAGRWPSNVLLTHAPGCGPDEQPGPCVDGCPVAELDQQSGVLTSGTNAVRTKVGSFIEHGGLGRPGDVQTTYGDTGGASRFFPTFRYQAKAPSRERPKLDGIAHPTVKPLALMAWLVRLLTPPGGVVLDPFAGSGTTLQAARDEGFDSIGIERDEAYVRLARHRLNPTPETNEVA